MSRTIVRNQNKALRREVIDILREVLSDPDFGLELTAHANTRLQKSVKSKHSGRFKTVNEIFAKYKN